MSLSPAATCYIICSQMRLGIDLEATAIIEINVLASIEWLAALAPCDL